MERIIQLLEETDRLKTFRGGICRGDPEILSPIKGDFRRIQRRGADNKPQNCHYLLKFIYLIYSKINRKIRSYCGSAANNVSKRWLLANCFVILVKRVSCKKSILNYTSK